MLAHLKFIPIYAAATGIIPCIFYDFMYNSQLFVYAVAIGLIVFQIGNKHYLYKKLISIMSLLNQNTKKGKKKDGKKAAAAAGTQGSKFIQKSKSGAFVSKQSNTGSQRGS